MQPEQSQKKSPTFDIAIKAADKQICDIKDELLHPLVSLTEQQLANLNLLKLSCNSYNAEVLTKIGEILKYATNLQSLDLSDCFMKKKSTDICQGLFNLFKPLELINLVEINISNNALGTKGSRIFSIGMERLVNLKVLLVANCGLGGIGSKQILDKIHWCSKLEIFSIGRNRLEIDGGMALGNALKHIIKIQQFYLFNNGIKQSAVHYLLQQINYHLKELVTLDISENFIGGPAVDKFVDLLGNKGIKLRHLNMSDCVEGADFPKVLGTLEKVRDPPILESFSLNYIELRNKEVAERLLKFLEKCPLKHLDMVGTEMNKQIRKQFTERLKNKLTNQLIFDEQDNDEPDLVSAFGSLKIR